MHHPSVSAVISVYNGAHYIASAVESVLAQTTPVDEIIVVDDGSSDDLAGALAPFGSEVLLLRQENRGVSVARNAGIEKAKGEWIALLDHDDVWLPEKQERLLQAVDGREEVGLVYSDVEVFGDEQRLRRFAHLPALRGNVFRQLLLINPITPSATIVRRDALLAAGGFDARLRNAQDRHMWLVLAARWPFEYVDAALVRYRVHSGNLSKHRRESLSNLYTILTEARGYAPDEYRAAWPAVRHQLAEVSFELGRICLEESDVRAARAWFARAARHRDHRVRSLAYLAAASLPGPARRVLREAKRSTIGTRDIYHDAAGDADQR